MNIASVLTPPAKSVARGFVFSGYLGWKFVIRRSQVILARARAHYAPGYAGVVRVRDVRNGKFFVGVFLLVLGDWVVYQSEKGEGIASPTLSFPATYLSQPFELPVVSLCCIADNPHNHSPCNAVRSLERDFAVVNSGSCVNCNALHFADQLTSFAVSVKLFASRRPTDFAFLHPPLVKAFAQVQFAHEFVIGLLVRNVFDITNCSFHFLLPSVCDALLGPALHSTHLRAKAHRRHKRCSAHRWLSKAVCPCQTGQESVVIVQRYPMWLKFDKALHLVSTNSCAKETQGNVIRCVNRNNHRGSRESWCVHLFFDALNWQFESPLARIAGHGIMVLRNSRTSRFAAAFRARIPWLRATIMARYRSKKRISAGHGSRTPQDALST